MKYLSLFSGIGAFEKALERLGIDYELVGFSEIDKYAIKSYCAVHEVDESLNLGDINKIDLDTIKKLGDIDLITHGSPCQDFSVAGLQAGGDEGSGTRSSLMWRTVDIVQVAKPKYVIWENVKNLLSKKHRHNFDSYLEVMGGLGYKSFYKVLNAKDYGVPQNRERVYTISIRCDLINDGLVKDYEFPEGFKLTKRLKDVLESEVDEKYYINDGMLNNIVSDNQAGFLSGGKWDKINESCRRYYKENGVGPTIHTCQGGNTEPKVAVAMRGRYNETGKTEQQIEVSNREIANSITTVQKDSMVGEKSNYVEKKYKNFINKKGYIPEMFNPYNETEIKDIAPTQSTQCGSTTSSATVLKLEEKLPGAYGRNFGSKGKIQDTNGECDTLQAAMGNGGGNIPIIKIKNNTKKGYLEATDGDGIYTNTTTKRGTVQKGICQTLTSIQDKGVIENNLRIRKLTPRECWRLMGFDDEDFDKAAEVPTSNTQLYKQAGNSICVPVLEAIFKNLFIIRKKKSWYR